MVQTQSIPDIIRVGVARAIEELYGEAVSPDSVTLSPTRKEFEGDYTVVVFPYSRVAKKKPDQIAEELGAKLQEALEEVTAYNVIKGFLNLSVAPAFWRAFLLDTYENDRFGWAEPNGKKVMVEFSSPNTNKPLHLGHIRNILLGWSTAQIMAAAGYEVVKVQIINDRGIAICKSMLAWQRFADGATPQSAGIKPDHFVGKYYVRFEQEFQKEYKNFQLSEAGAALYQERAADGQPAEAFWKKHKNTYFNEHSALGMAAKEMLRQWEAGEPDTVALWKQMNAWVYEGFDRTYEKLGVSFDKLYYESQTYLLGKDLVNHGLDRGVFERREDGSVWADLSDAKLDQKAVLRKDGTSLYITQDLGTARLRYDDFEVDKMVYVVADEQNYHFQVLFELLKRLEEPYAAGLYHLSYGMVDLPTGKMKSREGTVVDADDLVAEVLAEARTATQDRDTTAELSEEEQAEIIRKIGLAALKYFIIKVGPQKRMVFNPQESVDLQGQTGPYIQNAYVRIQSVLRKAEGFSLKAAPGYDRLEEAEKELLLQLYAFPELIQEAARSYDPSIIAAFCYDLAKNYHKFYHDHSILRAENEATKAFRLALCRAVANALRTGMQLLGIEMPERM